MKKVGLWAGCFLALTLSVSAETLAIGAQDVPPVFDAKAAHHGILGQILTESLKGSDYQLEYKLVPAVRALAMTDAGDITGGFVGGNMDNTQGKYKLRNLFNMYGKFFYKKSAFPNGVVYSSLADLKGYKVGIWAGSGNLADFKKTDMKLVIGDSEAVSFKKLAAGTVDLVFTLDYIGAEALRAIGEDTDDYGTTKELFTLPLAVAISSKDPKTDPFLKAFDAGFAQALKSGSLKKVFEPFYGVGKVPESLFRF